MPQEKDESSNTGLVSPPLEDPTEFIDRSFACVWNEGHSIRLINRDNPSWAISIPWKDIPALRNLLSGTRPIQTETFHVGNFAECFDPFRYEVTANEYNTELTMVVHLKPDSKVQAERLASDVRSLVEDIAKRDRASVPHEFKSRLAMGRCEICGESEDRLIHSESERENQCAWQISL
jgi:hypothetical protein